MLNMPVRFSRKPAMAQIQTQTRASDSTTLGILLMLAFITVAPVTEVFAKLVADRIPVGQITAARFAVQAGLLIPLVIALREATRPSLAELRLYVVRAALIVCSAGFIIGAVKYMPIADALAIVFVEPLILTLLGAAFLGDTIGWRRMAACIVGFIGCLLVVQPSFEAFGWVALLPFGTAICFAFYLILTRSMAQRVPPLTMQAYTGLAGILLSAPVLWAFDGSGNGTLDPVLPPVDTLPFLFGVGAAATISHIILAHAARMTPTAVIAPMQYLEIVSAAILGYLIWGDLLNGLALIGAIIIVGSGLFVFWRERASAP